MEKCPKCGSYIPITSKCCTNCGYVVSSSLNEPTDFSKEYKKITDHIDMVNNIEAPSFAQMFNHFTVILYPIIAVIFFVTGAIAGSLLLWAPSAIFVVLFIIALVRKLRNKDYMTIQRNNFLKLEKSFESLKSQITMMYGGNSHAQKAIEDAAEKFENAAERYKSTMNSKGMQGLVSVVVVAFLSLALGLWVCHALSQEPDCSDYVTNYLEVAKSSIDEGESARIETVQALIDCGNLDGAKEFFYSYCMGNVSDYAIAVNIAKALIKTSYEEAIIFIDNCNAMRYSTDRDRLYQLLK